MKTTSKILGWQCFFLMKLCKCQNLNSLFCEISFLELPKYSWNLRMVRMIEKFFWRIVEKLVRLLADEVERLACLWHVGRPSWIIGSPLARLLARWQVIMRSFHTFGTLARGHVDHAGMRFSKFSNALLMCKCDHENCN